MVGWPPNVPSYSKHYMLLFIITVLSDFLIIIVTVFGHGVWHDDAHCTCFVSFIRFLVLLLDAVARTRLLYQSAHF